MSLETNRSRSRRRWWAAGAGALPLVPILAALILTAGAQGTGPATVTSPFHPLATSSPKLPNQLIPPGSGALVAVLERPTVMRARPGSGPVLAHLGLHTNFGSPQAMWAAKLSGSWVGVVSAQAGNHRLGWIPAADASLSRVNWELRVSLSARRLTVLEAGRPVQNYTIAVGAPDAPTPTGRFAVTDRLNTGDPTGPYGCCILALSAQAPHAIQGWDGGNRIAIHSTPETSSIGHPVSHGCMRLTLAEGRWLLNHIPLGTPALISG